MIQNHSLMTLSDSDRRLEALLREVKAVRASSLYFCANSRWLFGLGGPCLKQKVEVIAGDDKKIYEKLAKNVYFALPDCKKCFCKVIGIRPKKSKFILMEQLFQKLADIANWCSKHPEDTERLHKKAQPLVDKLVSLGVELLIVQSVLIMGGVIDGKFLKQFEDLI